MNRAVTLFENTFAATAFAVISIIAFTNVISRYVLNASLAFTTEITVNLAVALTLVGAVIGIREKAHLGFSLVHDKANPAVKRALTVLVCAVIVTFFLVLFYYSLQLVLGQASSGRVTPSIGIPQWIFTAALPVGAALGIYRSIQSTLHTLRTQTDAPLIEQEA